MTSAAPSTFGVVLFEAVTSYRHALRRARGSLGITEAESRVVMYLSGRGGISQAELARLLHVKPITVTRLLDNLEKGGWVLRCADPKDRRTNRLELTPKGQSVVRQVWLIVSEVGETVAAGLEPHTLSAFVEALGQMRDALARNKQSNSLLDEKGSALSDQDAA